MRSGRLKHRISWYWSSKNNGITGAESLVLFGTFPCEIAPQSGKEFQALGGVTNVLTHKITMRYVNNFSPKLIGVFEGRRFKVNAVIDPNEDKRELQIIAQEVAG